MAAQAVHYCALLCNMSTTPEPIHTSLRIWQKLFCTLQKHKVSIKHQSISSRHVYLHCVSNLTHPKSLSQTFKHRRQHLSAREISRIQDLTLFSQLFSDGHRTKVFTSLCLLCLIRNWLWDSSARGLEMGKEQSFSSSGYFKKVQRSINTKYSGEANWIVEVIEIIFLKLQNFLVVQQLSWGDAY